MLVARIAVLALIAGNLPRSLMAADPGDAVLLLRVAQEHSKAGQDANAVEALSRLIDMCRSQPKARVFLPERSRSWRWSMVATRRRFGRPSCLRNCHSWPMNTLVRWRCLPQSRRTVRQTQTSSTSPECVLRHERFAEGFSGGSESDRAGA
jgi:hypothetical protein